MISFSGVYSYYPNETRTNLKYADGVITSWDWVFEGLGGFISLSIGDTHPPDNFINILNDLLMRFDS